MKIEYEIDKIREFVNRGYRSVTARHVEATLQHYDNSEKQKAELLEALIKAKELIKEWHNMGAGDMGEGLWAIYENKSPEMQPINNAIKKATQ